MGTVQPEAVQSHVHVLDAASAARPGDNELEIVRDTCQRERSYGQGSPPDILQRISQVNPRSLRQAKRAIDGGFLAQ